MNQSWYEKPERIIKLILDTTLLGVDGSERISWTSTVVVHRLNLSFFVITSETVELMMPFGVFQEAADVALGRPVFTHEFAKPDRLWDEFCNKVEA